MSCAAARAKIICGTYIGPALAQHWRELAPGSLYRCLQCGVEIGTGGGGGMFPLIEHTMAHGRAEPGLPLHEVERRAILAAIYSTGNVREASKQLGIGYSTVYRKLKEYAAAAREREANCRV